MVGVHCCSFPPGSDSDNLDYEIRGVNLQGRICISSCILTKIDNEIQLQDNDIYTSFLSSNKLFSNVRNSHTSPEDAPLLLRLIEL